MAALGSGAQLAIMPLGAHLGIKEANMRLSRQDLAPVLAIMVGGTLSMVAIAGVVDPALSSDAVASAPEVVLIEQVLQAQRERVPRDQLLLETRRSRVAGRVATEMLRVSDPPLFVIDGVPMEPGLLSMTVLRGGNAVELYGDDGSGGVVIISLNSEEPTVR